MVKLLNNKQVHSLCRDVNMKSPCRASYVWHLICHSFSKTPANKALCGLIVHMQHPTVKASKVGGRFFYSLQILSYPAALNNSTGLSMTEDFPLRNHALCT